MDWFLWSVGSSKVLRFFSAGTSWSLTSSHPSPTRACTGRWGTCAPWTMTSSSQWSGSMRKVHFLSFPFPSVTLPFSCAVKEDRSEIRQDSVRKCHHPEHHFFSVHNSFNLRSFLCNCVRNVHWTQGFRSIFSIMKSRLRWPLKVHSSSEIFPLNMTV